MNKVCLRFLLKGSPHMLEVISTEDKARQMVEAWTGNTGSGASGYDEDQRRYWAIRHDEVAGMLTIPLTADQVEQIRRGARGQGQPGQPMPSFPRTPAMGMS